MEISVVMMILGTVLAAIWFAAQQAHDTARVGDAVNEIHSITGGMTTLLLGGYGTNPAAPPCGAAAPPCDITGNMINAGVVPPSYVTGVNTVSNPWTATGLRIYWVGASAIVGLNPNPRTYRIALYNISSPGCLGLLPQIMSCPIGQPGCPDAGFAINTLTYTAGTQPAPGAFAAPANINIDPIPFPSTSTQNVCAGNTYPGPTNSIEWDFSQ